MRPSHWLTFMLFCLAAASCDCTVSREAKQSVEVSATHLQRHDVHFATATVSILSPGALEQHYVMSPDDMEETPHILNSEYFTTQLPEMEVAVSWIRYREGPINVHAGIEGIMSHYQDQSPIGFTYQIRDATVSGLTAARGSATHNANGGRAIESIAFSKDHEAWQVTVFIPLRDRESARRIVDSVDLRAQKVEQTKIKVTLEGQVYVNGTAASLEEAKEELKRLSEVNGIVLYYREGGNTPPPVAESVGVAIIQEISRLRLPNPVWSDEAKE